MTPREYYTALWDRGIRKFTNRMGRHFMLIKGELGVFCVPDYTRDLVETMSQEVHESMLETASRSAITQVAREFGGKAKLQSIVEENPESPNLTSDASQLEVFNKVVDTKLDEMMSRPPAKPTPIDEVGFRCGYSDIEEAIRRAKDANNPSRLQ